MRPIARTTWFLCGFALAAGGCRQAPEPVRLDPPGQAPRISYAPLQEVLSASVTQQGQLVPLGVREKRQALETQLKLLSVTGPDSTPDLLPRQQDRLAYWYNARMAWAIYLSLLHDFQDSRADKYIRERPFYIDGQWMTLQAIDTLLGKFEDFRILAAAPGVSQQRARLPNRVFLPEGIHQRIEHRFNQFVSDNQRFRIEVSTRRIHVPCILWQMRDRIQQRFARLYGPGQVPLRIALLWQVRGRARSRLQNAVGYQAVRAENRYCLAELLQ